METYSNEQQRIRDTWDEVSTITDEDSAVRYLTEGLGYLLIRTVRSLHLRNRTVPVVLWVVLVWLVKVVVSLVLSTTKRSKH